MELVAVIGVIAFLVSVVTEVLKGLGPIDKIPTQLLALILSVLGAIGWGVMTITIITPTAIITVIAVAFISALVSMVGWEKVKEIWERFNQQSKS